MQVTETTFPNKFLIMPTIDYFFGDVRNGENFLDIVATFSFKDIAEIYVTRSGGIAFTFLDKGPLQSITKYQTRGSGMVPDHARQNHDEIVDLQGRRLIFANFIAATLFGKLSAIRNCSLRSAQYAGMDEIVACTPSGSELVVEHSKHSNELFSPKVHLVRQKPKHMQIISPDDLEKAIDFVAHVSTREDEFQYADMQACMVMNYQAAILHNEQHAAASLALNFSVAEALIEEIFLAYGIVGDQTPKAFAKVKHTVPQVSKRQFSKWGLGQKISTLSDGNLIDHYLCQRIDEARKVRNHLMHRAVSVNVIQSGNMQTVVRDLWSLLIDEPFELITGYSMRM